MWLCEAMSLSRAICFSGAGRASDSIAVCLGAFCGATGATEAELLGPRAPGT